MSLVGWATGYALSIYGKEYIFKINKSFIGSNPNLVQNLSLKVIVEFLENIKKNESIKIMKNQTEGDLDFHILDRKTLKEIIKN